MSHQSQYPHAQNQSQGPQFGGNQAHGPQFGGPVPPPGQQPLKPPKKPMTRGARIGWSVLIGAGIFIVGVLIGSGGSAGEATTGTAVAATKPVPTATVTETVATAAPKPVQVTVTKTVPGPATTVTAKPPEAAGSFSGDGTYEVGVDIKPGKYKTTGGDGCYWARLKNLDGSFGAIIANNLGDGPQTVTIKKSDKGFETARCGEWRKVG